MHRQEQETSSLMHPVENSAEKESKRLDQLEQDLWDTYERVTSSQIVQADRDLLEQKLKEVNKQQEKVGLPGWDDLEHFIRAYGESQTKSSGKVN